MAEDGSFAPRLQTEVQRVSGQPVSKAEARSWKQSLPVLARELIHADLAQIEVLVEHQLPLSSKRVDAILTGSDPRTGADRYLVVELKQWSYAETWEDDEQLALVDGVPHPRLHPSLQVGGYCEYLQDFVPAIGTDRKALKGVAYLHNATDDAVSDLFDLDPGSNVWLFTGQRREDFINFLRSTLVPSAAGAATRRLLASDVRPSKQLLSLAADVMKRREHFTLLAEQRLAYELSLHAVERARTADSKEVVVVTGGPGSGKSVIALTLLSELFNRGVSALHATGSKSFTETMRRYPGKGSTRLKSLFKYFNSFMDARPNQLDVLICDEAHRIRETSANRYTSAELRTGRPQIEELISAARVPVFLLDQYQVVKPGEI
jgi:hypothetical protein